ncbi:NUDIX domain-containing protein [Sphingobium sp. EM0848]|uniref:NUDIX domain-containing protein n=1 Tax=Sphingobium sp. EM0848 TaxID=2743473 RepID=UPI00159C8EC0|nr:NUDIX domain-containing protein [Sphingobium sp. EM0848]
MTRQSGAIPFRINVEGEPEILLVTSKRSGRWVLLKGEVKRDMLPDASAAREAFEEGGVLGSISGRPVATYRQIK